MRRVKIFKRVFDKTKKTYVRAEDIEGNFIEYGVNHEEFEAGPGNYTCGVIEMDDGTIRLIDVYYFEFILSNDGF